MAEPDKLRRPIISPNAETASGLAGAPTSVRLPSRRRRWRYALISWSAETASRMKSKLPACFCISFASRETTTSSAPRRRASSFLWGEVVKTTTWGPECVSELDAHVAETAESDHADLFSLGHAPVTHRRIGGNPGTEERSGPGEVQIGGGR